METIFLKRAVGTMIVLVTALMLGFSSPSVASVGDIAQGVVGGRIYVSPSVDNVRASGDIDPRSAIVVVNSDDVGAQSLSSFAHKLRDATDREEKVLIVISNDSNDTEVISSAGINAGTIHSFSSGARSGQSRVDAFVKNMDNITTLIDRADNAEGDNEGDFKPMDVLVKIGTMVASGMAVVFSVIVIQRAFKNKRKMPDDNASDEVAYVSNKNTPPRVKELVKDIANLAEEHDKTSLILSENMRTLVRSVNILFTEPSRDQRQYQRADDEYSDKLSKLYAVLGESYCLDIGKNPGAWEDPDMKVREVGNAVLALDTEVSSNIRKAKSRSDLDFSYSLDHLYHRAVREGKDEKLSTPDVPGSEDVDVNLGAEDAVGTTSEANLNTGSDVEAELDAETDEDSSKHD